MKESIVFLLFNSPPSSLKDGWPKAGVVLGWFNQVYVNKYPVSIL